MSRPIVPSRTNLVSPVPQHWRFKPTRNLGVDVDLTSEMGCDPPKTAMSLTGWWFGTWLLFSPIVGMMIESDELIFVKTIKPTKQFMICWVCSPVKSGFSWDKTRKMPSEVRGLWSGDCGRSQCLQHSESRGPGVSADSTGKKCCCELPSGKLLHNCGKIHHV